MKGHRNPTLHGLNESKSEVEVATPWMMIDDD